MSDREITSGMSPTLTPTSGDVARRTEPLLVVPLGSWEQHGSHLPLDTDTRIACELADRLTARVPNSVRGPAITVSSSGEHAGFAGTLSIGGPVVTDLLIELVRSADWADGVVIVNGHGGNVDYLVSARQRLVDEGHSVLVWSAPLVDPHDSHAGYVETSLLLAIDPASVRIGEISEAPAPHLDDIIEDLRRHGVMGVSPTGVLGDPRRADASLGHRLLDSWGEDLHRAVTRWRTERATG